MKQSLPAELPAPLHPIEPPSQIHSDLLQTKLRLQDQSHFQQLEQIRNMVV